MASQEERFPRAEPREDDWVLVPLLIQRARGSHILGLFLRAGVKGRRRKFLRDTGGDSSVIPDKYVEKNG